MVEPSQEELRLQYEEMHSGLEKYSENAWETLSPRWEMVRLEIFGEYVADAIGGLMARQCSLTTEIAVNPEIWNGHIAPLILRCMVDTHITLSWILKDPSDRSKKFVLYGLGQEKLQIELLKVSPERNEEVDKFISFKENWLNSHRSDFLTEVNVGSMSGLTTRKMAQQAGCEDLYKYAYTPFSGAAHSQWQHISLYNLKRCGNPLHKYHNVPCHVIDGVNPDYFYRSAKYLDLSLDSIDQAYKLDLPKFANVGYFETLFAKADNNSNESE